MNQKDKIIQFLKILRKEIIHQFEEFETYARFEYKPWPYKETGGGEIGLLRGSIFEKAAVNWSGISGEKFPMDDATGPFFATGISLITHMHNPHAPTVHMNLRYFETEKGYWIGGGYDLTPMGFPYEDDTTHFHETAKTHLDTLDPSLYPRFSAQAKEYFFVPHLKRERGVGGLFFDHLNSGSFEIDFALLECVGTSFLKAIMPIYHKRIQTPYTRHDKEIQLEKRAHYVEFNLLYDRGTKFGFASGGNPDAILCSMPPLAKW
jgi:coproporphyrinogen III oxidase